MAALPRVEAEEQSQPAVVLRPVGEEPPRAAAVAPWRAEVAVRPQVAAEVLWAAVGMVQLPQAVVAVPLPHLVAVRSERVQEVRKVERSPMRPLPWPGWLREDRLRRRRGQLPSAVAAAVGASEVAAAALPCVKRVSLGVASWVCP